MKERKRERERERERIRAREGGPRAQPSPQPCSTFVVLVYHFISKRRPTQVVALSRSLPTTSRSTRSTSSSKRRYLGCRAFSFRLHCQTRVSAVMPPQPKQPTSKTWKSLGDRGCSRSRDDGRARPPSRPLGTIVPANPAPDQPTSVTAETTTTTRSINGAMGPEISTTTVTIIQTITPGGAPWSSCGGTESGSRSTQYGTVSTSACGKSSVWTDPKTPTRERKGDKS